MIFQCKGRLISNTAGRLAQKQPSFKECVTAHLNILAFWRVGDFAPKMNGPKESTEDGRKHHTAPPVGELSYCSEAIL